MSDRLAQVLPTFLPSALLREVSATASVHARHWCRTAAALSIDISGFSALTETLGASGAYGAEQLASRLSEVFDPVIQCIHEHHGEIEEFAGDNVLASWSSDKHQLATHAAPHSHARNRSGALGLPVKPRNPCAWASAPASCGARFSVASMGASNI